MRCPRGARRGSPSSTGLPLLQNCVIIFGSSKYDISVTVTRFYALIKLDKVETEEEMKVMLENLPNEYAAMLGQ